MSTSRNGWPLDPAVAKVFSPHNGDTATVRAGDVREVFQHFIRRYQAEVEPVRIINGYRTTTFNAQVGGDARSNHVSATAIDLNGDDHPYEILLPAHLRWGNYRHGFTAGQINAVRNILRWFEGTLYWGLDFNAPYRDGMHYEIRGTYAQVARIAQKVRATWTVITPPAPPEDDLPLNDADKAWFKGAIADAVKGATETAARLEVKARRSEPHLVHFETADGGRGWWLPKSRRWAVTHDADLWQGHLNVLAIQEWTDTWAVQDWIEYEKTDTNVVQDPHRLGEQVTWGTSPAVR